MSFPQAFHNMSVDNHLGRFVLLPFGRASGNLSPLPWAAFLPSIVVQGYSGIEGVGMAGEVSERAAKRVGVWNDPSAPDGHVALVVISSSGKRLLRIEIAAEAYSLAWVTWLERWLRRYDSGFLRIVR